MTTSFTPLGSGTPEPTPSDRRIPVDRRPIRIGAAVTLVVLAVALALVAVTSERVERFLAGKSLVREQLGASETWFDDEGVLVSRRTSGDSVFVWRWSAGSSAPTTQGGSLSGGIVAYDRAIRAGQQSGTFVLSPDERGFASYYGGALHAFRLDRDGLWDESTTVLPRPRAMGYADGNYLAVAINASEDTSSRSELVTLVLFDEELRTIASRRFDADAIMWPTALRAHGPFVSLVMQQGDTTRIEVVDPRQPQRYRAVRYRSDIDASVPIVAISRGGLVAVASGDETVRVFDMASMMQAPDLVRARGPVGYLLFADRNHLLLQHERGGLDIASRARVGSSWEVEPLFLGSETEGPNKSDDERVQLVAARWPSIAIRRPSTTTEVYSVTRGTTFTGYGGLMIAAAVLLGIVAWFLAAAKEKPPARSVEAPSSADAPADAVTSVVDAFVDEGANASALRDDLSTPLPSTLPPPPPQALVDAIARGECILFAGAGLSAQAGVPPFGLFLRELVEFGRREGMVPEAHVPALHRSLNAGIYEAAADELSDTIPQEAIARHLRERLDDVFPSPLHRRLARLPFVAALTTNFDSLVDEAFATRNPAVRVPSDTAGLLEDLRFSTFFVLKLFGSPAQPTSLVYSTRRYREAMAKNLQFREVVQSLFLRNTLFFVGASLGSIRDYLDGLELASTAITREHFALVGEATELDEVEVRLLKRKYGITVLGFRPSPEYPEVADFVDQVTRALGSVGYVGAEDAPKRLQRLQLHNIGPFEHLDLAFESQRTILLGDNGMGKSIILKSIAAALCGREASEESVTQLLRAGAKGGSIELQVGTDIYSVDLQRDTEGKVQIRSASLSPLKLGKWLVLGFPPLRAITWKRPDGPTPLLAPDPSPRDLLPILSTEPDTRLNNLKQWLVNLDRQGEGRDADPNAKRILDRFFEAVRALTPGMAVRLASIDKRTNAILLDTAGGLIPIELVSQGMVSALCWIGVLLERLYEVHQAQHDPEEGGALVLIDEIDAHMHPRWQHSLMGPLASTFTSVQFIASTHSPLIVAGLGASEILVLHRDAAGDLRVEHPDIAPQGLRADQILTSPLFNLDSTRDPETTRAMLRYTELTAKGFRYLDEAERDELERHSAALEVRLPDPSEREEARMAYAMIEKSLEAQLASMPPERMKRIVDEARVQLQEAVTGSRRPE
jgi:hypothetical protein